MPSKNTCYWATNARGKYNRKHQCTVRCQWTMRDCIDHLNRTPLPTHDQPTIQVYTPPCQYGKSENEHWVNAGDANGHLRGTKREPCKGELGICHTQPRRHLPSCDCLDCVAQIRVA